MGWPPNLAGRAERPSALTVFMNVRLSNFLKHNFEWNSQNSLISQSREMRLTPICMMLCKNFGLKDEGQRHISDVISQWVQQAWGGSLLKIILIWRLVLRGQIGWVCMQTSSRPVKYGCVLSGSLTVFTFLLAENGGQPSGSGRSGWACR